MKATYYLIAIFLGLIFSSCATILLDKTHNMEVRSNEKNAVIQIYDTTYILPTLIEVPRSKRSLPITLKTDSLKLDFVVKPSLNNAFKYANLPIPFGYLVDLTNNKRYGYGKYLFLDSTDTTYLVNYAMKKNTIEKSEKKGNLYLLLSIPHINTFSLAPEGEKRYTHLGFWGIGAGVDYYYQDNRFLNLSVATVSDAFILFPTIADFDGDGSLMTSTYMSISHNHRLGDFSLGYGVSLSKNTWDFYGTRRGLLEILDKIIDKPKYHFDDEGRKKSSIALGFVFPLILNMGERVTLGLTYRPSFYRPQLERKFRYEALLSLSLNCRIGLINKK